MRKPISQRKMLPTGIWKKLQMREPDVKHANQLNILTANRTAILTVIVILIVILIVIVILLAIRTNVRRNLLYLQKTRQSSARI